MRNRKVLLLLPLVLLMACGAKNVRTPILGGFTSEQIARGVAEKFSAFLTQAKSNHPECSADQPGATQGICPAIHRAIDIQNGLVRAVNMYCSGAPIGNDALYANGGPCSPVLGAEPNLNGAMSTALAFLSQNASLGGAN